MKQVKKLLSLVLAMMLVIAMGMSALAAEPSEDLGEAPSVDSGTSSAVAGNDLTGKITINDALPEQTYSVYQIFTLESYDRENGTYAYKVNDAWKPFVSEGGKGYEYVSVENGYVTWKGDNSAARVAEFAKLALEFAEKNEDISAVETKKTGAEETTVVFENLPLGYYLVDSSAGALCSLDTTQTDVIMREKNDVPTVDKEVQTGTDGDGNPQWGNTNTATIGTEVNYRATITVTPGAENYVMHDKMTGLDFVRVTGITFDDNALDAKYYTVSSSELEDDCNFEVSFTTDFYTDYANELENGESHTLIVSYVGKVNADAVIKGDGNPNDAKLEYGDGNETKWDKTITYVYDFEVFKYTLVGEGDAATENALSGAKFTLSANEDGSDAIKFVTAAEEDGVPVYKVADSEDAEGVEIVTDENGRFKLSGLAAGIYYLTETEAPAGYNKLAGAIQVEIDEDGTVNMLMKQTDGTEAMSPVDEVKVLNNTGAELPSTGGIGTTIFYVLGGILVVGAGIMLVVKKRMSSEK